MKVATVIAVLSTLCLSHVVGTPLQSKGANRLIQLSETESKWMTEMEVMWLMSKNIKFMDVTDHQTSFAEELPNGLGGKIPNSPKHQDDIEKMFLDISQDEMRERLEKFSSFFNRYYKSEYGKESSEWLLSQAEDVKAASQCLDHLEINRFEHSGWPQISVIAKFHGKDDAKKKEVVVLSAHLDSTAGFYGMYNRAPGADDNGSGSTTMFEVFHVLAKNCFQPDRTVEFHWYSGEEAGLLGSQAVSAQYRKDKIPVIGNLHFDMTGYVGAKKPVFGVITDYTDPKLTTFIRKLINTYTETSMVDTKCGYACSDHASWKKAGYASAFIIETDFKDSNPNIHSARDTVDKLDFSHMQEFAQVGLSFAVEMSY